MGPLSILIVDDEPDIANLMRLMLLKEAPQLNIHLAESGQECLEYIKENPVDCILSDYQMPYMDGMELLITLREQGSDVPFIFVTGQGNEEIARNAFKNGANDYFTKDLGGFAHFARILNSVGQAARQRKTEAAKKEELIFRQAIESSVLSGIVGVDTEGRINYVNSAFCKMVGWSEEELLGQGPPFVYWPPEETEEINDAFMATMRGEMESSSLEFKFMRKGGERFDALFLISAIKDARGLKGWMGAVYDITERKKTEEALRESESKFKKLADESVAGIWISQDWRLVYANPSMSEIVGYTVRELLERETWFDLVHPEDLQKTMEAVAGVLPGKSAHIELRVVKKDGSVIDIESRSAYTLYNGRPAVMGIAIDITERKRFERELVDERNRARKCFDFARSMMVVIAPDETVARINQKGCEVLGYSEEEVIGKNWFDNFIPEGRRADVRGVFNQMMAGEAVLVEYYENPVLTKDGQERLIDWRNSVFYDEKEKDFFSVSSGEDITERKKAEEALLKSEARYRAFIANSSEGIWRYELEEPVPTSLPEDEQIALFYKHAYLAECNDAMARMYGFEKAGDMIGVRLFETMPRSDPRNINYLRDLIRAGYRLEKEETYEKDVHGNIHVFLNNYNGVVENGRLVRAWGVQRDITAQRLAEHQKEDFYAMVTHDLKSPLTAILGYAELLTSKLSGGDRDIFEMAKAISSSGERLGALLENFLTISKTEAGKLTVHPSPSNVATVLREACSGLEKEMLDKNLAFHAEIGQDLPKVLSIDHKLVQRAVSNLLQNAINYTQAGGHISLTTKCASEANCDFFVISVADTGRGIPEAELENIFKKYYRSQRTAGTSGTGLGLAIVKAVAEAHGGRVEVESEPGRGSVFRLYLPTRLKMDEAA
ncbi:MAG: PAS domain S-box protein [Nitrospirota bacterium]